MNHHLPSFTIICHHLPIKWPPFPYPLPSFPVGSPTTHQVFWARPLSILLLLGWPYLHQAYQQSALDSNVKMVLPAMPQLVPKKPPGTLAIKSLVPNKMETKKQLCDYEISFLESFSGTPNKMETNPHKRWELLRKILGISGAGTDVPRSWQTVASWPGTLWQLDRRGSASHFFNGAPRKSCGNLGNLEISLEIHHRNPIFGHFSASCWGNSCFESRAACSRACWSWILYHGSEQVPILEALSKFGLTFCSYAAHRAIWKHRTQYCPPPELHTS